MSGIDYDGVTIIHNHPKSEGITSFGKNDFDFIKEYMEIKELIAVNSQYNYSVQVLEKIKDVTYGEAYGKGVKYLSETSDYQHAVFL